MLRSPKTLWHYTDAAGLHGIVTSTSLRLADARFLNDRTERQHGVMIVTEVIADALRKGQDHFLAVTAHFLAKRQTHAIHLCSFSEVSNSLSQWQRYGADGYGYCLGFSTAALRRILSPSVHLRQVVYNAKRQRELVRKELATLRAAFRRANEERDASTPEGLLLGTSSVIAAMVLDGVALRLKDASFSDEREWRLIQGTLGSGIAVEQVTFSPRGNFVKPFTELQLTKTRKTRSPLTAVVCGPRLDGNLAVSTVSYFLKSAGLNIEASWSELHKVWR